jgi:hypothetical protein
MAPEAEYPYPVQAVVDLTTNFSADHFRFAVRQCRDVIATVIAEDNRSDQQIARVHILRYLDLQLSRAVRWIEDEADLMALVVRSQIDLRSWAEVVSRGPAEATQFLHEANIDIREMHERIDKAFPGEIPPLPGPIEGKRIQLKRSGDEEEVIFKLCSKLIHPTAIVLVDLGGWVYSSAHREMLAVKVVWYGWGILSMLHKIEWVA